MGPVVAGLTWLLLTLAPSQARAQTDIGQPDPVLPFPIGHDRMDAGGFYTLGEFEMFRQSNSLGHQPIAVRGFTDSDGTITGTVGAFVGSHQPALFADDAAGPGSYQPGFKIGFGWRFQDGTALEVNWLHLFRYTYFHEVTLAPFGLRAGQRLQNSFLSAPVFDFPIEEAGPPDVLDPAGNPQTALGVWNAASNMLITFTQRTDAYELTWRQPIMETDCWRCYGLVGPRFFWIWERFRWRTVDLNISGDPPNLGDSRIIFGQTDPITGVAVYTNIVSNRMYGAHAGFGNEWYLGRGFSVSLDLEAALYLDIVKERARYETGEKFIPIGSKRSITTYTPVVEGQGNLNLWWYPAEAIQVRLGYNLMGFLNTIAAEQPVSFDWGAVDPPWVHKARFFDGLNAGIAIIF
jgi:hypothetical protein